MTQNALPTAYSQLPVPAVVIRGCRGRIIGKAPALSGVNVLESGVKAVIGRISLGPRRRRSSTTGTTGSATPWVWTLVLTIGIGIGLRVGTTAPLAGLGLIILGIAVVIAPIRVSSTFWPLGFRWITGAVVSRNRGGLRLLKCVPAIGPGISADGVQAGAGRGRLETVVVGGDRGGYVSQQEGCIPQGIIDFGTEETVGVLAGFDVALAGLGEAPEPVQGGRRIVPGDRPLRLALDGRFESTSASSRWLAL